MEHQTEMGIFVQQLADKPLYFGVTTYAEKMSQILQFYSKQGRTLEYCCQPLILNRKPATLKKWCREHGISFPDYTPLAMKKKDAETTETAENPEE